MHAVDLRSAPGVVVELGDEALHVLQHLRLCFTDTVWRQPTCTQRSRNWPQSSPLLCH